MPRANKAVKAETDKCEGGRSFGCKHETHEISKSLPTVNCRRCGERMGCGACVQIPQELVCLNCHDWADEKGLKAHGPMVPRERRVEAIKAVFEVAKRV